MKKNVAGIILCLLLVVGIVGCGKSDSSAEKKFVGKWELETMEENGEVTDASVLAELGLSITLELTTDKKCKWDFFSDQTEGKWELKDDTTVTLSIEDSTETVEAKISNGKLTLEQDGAKMVFKK